jgi:hypothetical protein
MERGEFQMQQQAEDERNFRGGTQIQGATRIGNSECSASWWVAIVRPCVTVFDDFFRKVEHSDMAGHWWLIHWTCIRNNQSSILP